MMKFVTLHRNQNCGYYSYKSGSDIKLDTLEDFFSDLGHDQESILFFKEWPFDDSQNECISTNITRLEKKDNNYIYLSTLIPVDDGCIDDATLPISYQQFSQLMHDWQEKVCKNKPTEVTIIYGDHQFQIETKN